MFQVVLGKFVRPDLTFSGQMPIKLLLSDDWLLFTGLGILIFIITKIRYI